MTKEQKKDLLYLAFLELVNGVAELARPTHPQTPFPRPPKPVALGPDITLSLVERDVSYSPYKLYRIVLEKTGVPAHIFVKLDPQDAQGMAQSIVANIDRPRDLVRALRRIQWLAAWARKRADGRRRAAEEILRQQRKWVDILESEMAIRKLAS
jgi:hypothetical protein